ncbi:rhodanese-like domain-containing protein [Bacteroidota bacterium]
MKRALKNFYTHGNDYNASSIWQKQASQMKTIFYFFLLMIISPVVSTTWSYSDITPAEVHTRLVEGDTLILLDVREISEYFEGHIAEPDGQLPLTPVNMPWNSNVLAAEYGRLPGNIDIIVYCRSGGRSALASAFLESNGFSRIYNMTGGFLSWSYETRDSGFGDHTGQWVTSSGPDPVIVTCVESGDTSKIIFPVSAIPGTDSIYLELHFASPYEFIPPNVPQSDFEGLFRVSALDPFGLSLFISDSLPLSDIAEIILVPEFHGNIVFDPELKVFIPGEEWRMVSSNFVIPAFYRNESVLRNWYNGEGFLTTDVMEFHSHPEKYEIQVFPNPFNGSVQIVAPAEAIIYIYDVRGRLIEKLNHPVWSPAGSVGSGLYFVNAQLKDKVLTKKVIYLK